MVVRNCIQRVWGKVGKGGRKFSATFVSLLKQDEDDDDTEVGTYLPRNDVSLLLSVSFRYLNFVSSKLRFIEQLFTNIVFLYKHFILYVL